MNGRPETFGLRGISWLYENLNGMLLAAPELEKMFEAKQVVGGKLEIEIRDVSGKQCDAARANLVSIYTRIAGPEVMSALAEPVHGECRWIARYEVTIPGAYTVLARLLHYNGLQDVGDECRAITTKPELEQTYVELLVEVPRYHGYADGEFDCCETCSRFKDCSFSLSANLDAISKWGSGKKCVLFKKSSNLNRNAIRGDQVHAILANGGKFSLCETGSRLKEYPLGTIWQLGCGRDGVLMRWAPCGSFGAPVGSSMRGTEDIILFEHEHRDLLIDPNIDIPQWATTIEKAQNESDAPIGDKDFKPVCDWNKLRITDFEKGRWTRSPFFRHQSCGPFTTFQASLGRAFPQVYPKVDDPICALRFDLQNLNDINLLNPPTRMSYKTVWRTELSDSYFIRDGKDVNTPFVPGPWVGYFRLHPSSPCRMPPLRSVKQIRQCFIERNFTKLTTRGDSIIMYIEHYLNSLFPAVFPDRNEYKFLRDPRSETNILFQWSNITGTKAFLADASAPHLMFGFNIHQNDQTLEDIARDYGKGYNVRIMNTPPFMLWERRPYMTAERTLVFREMMRKKFDKYGWYEVDFTTLSAAWTIDSTIERDSLHVIGHAMVIFMQLIVDIMCRVPFH